MARPKNTAPQKNSTVAIDAETSKMLDVFCQRYNLTKKEYIKASLDFFNITESNPLEYIVKSDSDISNTELKAVLDTYISQNENQRTEANIARSEIELVRKQNETLFKFMQTMNESVTELHTARNNEIKAIKDTEDSMVIHQLGMSNLYSQMERTISTLNQLAQPNATPKPKKWWQW